MKKLSLHTMLHNPWIRWGVGLSLVAVAVFFYPKWWPALNGWIDGTVAARKESMSEAGEGDAHSDEEHDHAHEEDGHDHAGHDESSTLELTPQSLKNLGLTAEYLRPIELSNFYRTVTVPAIVVAKPGRTDIKVSSPMIGIVQHVHAVSGEAVVPGDMLFEVRLTYEDLVDTQTQLIKNLADVAVEEREITRLEEVTRSGAVASKILLER